MVKRATNEWYYKGFTIQKMETTTTVLRVVPGSIPVKYYESIEHVFDIEGLKPYGQRPFITSVRQAKSYINEWLSGDIFED